MNINLPLEIGDGRIDTLLKLFVLVRELRSKPLTLNWNKVKHLSPAGHAILACFFDSVIEKKCLLKNVFVKKKLKNVPVVKNLLEHSDFQVLPQPSIHDINTQDLILKGNESSIDLSFMDQVRVRYQEILSEDLLFSCALIHNELMQNSVDHSVAERYYSYAGPWGKEFHLGVLDMGITIPAKLEQKYSFVDDVEAIGLALKLGVSTRRQRTGGLGLNHTFELLKEYQGRLTIVSRNAQLRRYFKRRKIAKGPLKHTLNGTWCFMHFPLEGI
jgi:hypothetical protein